MTPPDEGPTNREFGHLQGTVDGLIAQISRLVDSNTREHEAVIARFDRLEGSIRDALDSKADKDVVIAQGVVLDKLKTDRDLAVGVFRFGAAFKGALGFLLAAIGYLVGGGKHP